MLILFDTETVSCHSELVSCHAELVSASKQVVSAYFTETLKQVQGDVQGDSIRVTRSGMLNLFQRPACLQATISSSVNQSAAKSIYFGFSVFMRFHFQALCQFSNCFSRLIAFCMPLNFFKIHQVCQMVPGSEYGTAATLVLEDPLL